MVEIGYFIVSKKMYIKKVVGSDILGLENYSKKDLEGALAHCGLNDNDSTLARCIKDSLNGTKSKCGFIYRENLLQCISAPVHSSHGGGVLEAIIILMNEGKGAR
tara:strand:- start:824 stop:1138 length:315 start_codon:yes stop_codon:yes gene_type:complete